MSLLTGTGVGRYYGAQDVFAGLAFSIEPGDRIGLVGANGEGKTTLLRLLAGIDVPDSGQIFRKRDLRLGYLPQDPAEETRDTSLWDHMLTAFTRLRDLEEQLADEARLLEAGPGRDSEPAPQAGVPESGAREVGSLERYSALQAEFERCEEYTCEHRIRTVLHGLGFSRAQDGQPLSQLSGGQRTRALLAHMLLEDADLLLLDEPTNHLDLLSQEVLEAVLSEYEGTLILVSHDRYLIQTLGEVIWSVADGTVASFCGTWDEFAASREAAAGAAAESGRDGGASLQTQRERSRHERRQRKRREQLDRRHHELEESIAALEEELRRLGEEIGRAGEKSAVDRVRELVQEYQALEARLESEWAVWEAAVRELEGEGPGAHQRTGD